MKQITTRQLMTMPANERDEMLKGKFEIGVRGGGRQGEFFVKGLYVPMSKAALLIAAIDEFDSFDDVTVHPCHVGFTREEFEMAKRLFK